MGRKVGNFVIDRPLATGGMAVVYVARHPTLGREVAVKFLSPEFEGDAQLTERFLLEARVTASLGHKNVVQIFDFGELDGRSYYTMELLRGADLSRLIQQRQRLHHGEVCECLEQICEALDAAHNVGVVHRDLKPANIFVSDETPRVVKLMDFGVAKVGNNRSPSGTRHGQILGTPTHMSPEQALGQIDKISPQSDLYSLGVIAYEMLTGRLPFESDSEVLLMTMHIKDTAPSIVEQAPDVPPRIARLIEACLAKDPDARPSSARLLGQQLNAASRVAGRTHPSKQAEEAESSVETSSLPRSNAATSVRTRADGSAVERELLQTRAATPDRTRVDVRVAVTNSMALGQTVAAPEEALPPPALRRVKRRCCRPSKLATRRTDASRS